MGGYLAFFCFCMGCSIYDFFARKVGKTRGMNRKQFADNMRCGHSVPPCPTALQPGAFRAHEVLTSWYYHVVVAPHVMSLLRSLNVSRMDHINALFDVFDVNNDGEVSYEECVTGLALFQRVRVWSVWMLCGGVHVDTFAPGITG